MTANRFCAVPERPLSTNPAGSSPTGTVVLVLMTTDWVRRVDLGKNGSFPKLRLSLKAEMKGEVCPGTASTLGRAAVCARAEAKHMGAHSSAMNSLISVVGFTGCSG